MYKHNKLYSTWDYEHADTANPKSAACEILCYLLSNRTELEDNPNTCQQVFIDLKTYLLHQSKRKDSKICRLMRPVVEDIFKTPITIKNVSAFLDTCTGLFALLAITDSNQSQQILDPKFKLHHPLGHQIELNDNEYRVMMAQMVRMAPPSYLREFYELARESLKHKCIANHYAWFHSEVVLDIYRRLEIDPKRPAMACPKAERKMDIEVGLTRLEMGEKTLERQIEYEDRAEEIQAETNRRLDALWKRLDTSGKECCAKLTAIATAIKPVPVHPVRPSPSQSGIIGRIDGPGDLLLYLIAGEKVLTYSK